MKFFIVSTYGEMLDVAMFLRFVKKHEVVMWIPNHEYSKIGDGLIEKDDKWWRYTDGSWTFLVDGCERGALQDDFRGSGIGAFAFPKRPPVFGGSEKGDEIENVRQIGQELFKKAGFVPAVSYNFTSIDDTIAFVKSNLETLWVLKQNADAPKSINYVGRFEHNEDMLYHLESLKKRWNESEMGAFDCDLMEKVEGLEVAASAYFNGHDYMKNKDGKVVVFLNFEEKKEGDGGTGETTGEMGTLFLVTTEDHPLAQEILMRPVLIEAFKNAGIRGIVDVNCIQTDKGMVALEATDRPGVPSTSFEFLMATKDVDKVIAAVANGEDTPVEVVPGVGMVMVVVAKPFPIEADLEGEATSIGEKLWILDDGQPIDDFTEEQRLRIHLENFCRDDEDGHYFVATKNGYLLTVVGMGETIKSVREELIEYIKSSLYVAGMKYRTDIGQRVEEYEAQLAVKGTVQPRVEKKEVSKAQFQPLPFKVAKPAYVPVSRTRRTK